MTSDFNDFKICPLVDLRLDCFEGLLIDLRLDGFVLRLIALGSFHALFMLLTNILISSLSLFLNEVSLLFSSLLLHVSQASYTR